MAKSNKSSSQTRGASSRTRRERLDAKEGAIVQAAFDMFAEKGFAKSTISEIAKVAGVAEGTVYLYFKNKEALAVAVIASFYDRITVVAQEKTPTFATTEEKLLFLAEHHLLSIYKGRRILQLLSILDRDAETHVGGDLYELNKRYVSVFDGVVREGVFRGDIGKSFTPWILRDVFYGGLDYAMRTMMITDRKNIESRFARELVSMIMSQSDDHREPTSRKKSNGLEQLTRRLEVAADRIEHSLANQDVTRKPTP